MSAVADVGARSPAAVGEGMTPKALWTLAITSVAVFMVTLDNLVVTTAIPVIRKDLHASLSGLQWTVNAYTLAVLRSRREQLREPVEILTGVNFH